MKTPVAGLGGVDSQQLKLLEFIHTKGAKHMKVLL